MQGQASAIRSLVSPVSIHAAGHLPATFTEASRESSLHKAQPVAVDLSLIFGVHRCDRVFAVHNGGDRGFTENILNPGRIALADTTLGIKLNFNMNTIVFKQDGTQLVTFLFEADKLFWASQSSFAAIFESHYQVSGIGTIPLTSGM